MPGCQARMSGSPLRRSKRCSYSCLTACPGPGGRRPRLVAGGGRACGACCFAGQLRSPAPRTGRRGAPGPLGADDLTSFPTSTPTSFPTRWGTYPGLRWPSASVLISTLRGAVERTGRVVRFARSIQRPVRVLGVPSARAACGGSVSLPWSLRRPRGVRSAQGHRPDRPDQDHLTSIEASGRCRTRWPARRPAARVRPAASRRPQGAVDGPGGSARPVPRGRPGAIWRASG
jgi:hypothetical protein